jgi:Cu2+-exporting ATPase
MQDRAAEPIKDREISEVDAAAFKETQEAIEGGASSVRVAFSVAGLSCMGCVWLVQRLSEKQPGLVHAEANLSARRLDLEWLPGQFDLQILAAELQRFGYHLDPCALRSRPGVSSISVRLGLCAIFTLNMSILWAYQHYVEPGNGLVSLLCLVCLAFVFILGALPFYVTVSRALRIRHLHPDFFPVMIITASILCSVYSLANGALMLTTIALMLSSLISVLLLARYLIRCL